MSKTRQRVLQFAPTTAVFADRSWLGLQIDHRQFLNALQEEWLCPSDDQVGRMMGIDSFAVEQKGTTQQTGNLITVGLCFDPRLLPNLTVPVWSAGAWQDARIDSLPSTAGFVFWPGAIPFFAITRITVKGAEERDRLLGLIRQVSNVSVPDAVIDINKFSVRDDCGNEVPNVNGRGIRFTEEYGHVRGAMTMALWAIPRVDPWFDILVAMLAIDVPRLMSAAETVAASWFAEAPWLPRVAENKSATCDCRLWSAALRALLEASRGEGIDAIALVERVHNYATTSRSMKSSCENWREQTISVLRGNENFRLDDWKQCPVGKALQVLLLRPQPEHFAKWLHDLPGMPPAVWFSAATLCGYLHGYRRLPTTFRGGAVQRRTLAIHALSVTSDSPKPLTWHFTDSAKLTWRRDDREFVLMCGEDEFARKSAYPRTLWYTADLNDAVVNHAAEELARRLGWNCFKRKVRLSNTLIPFISQPDSEVSIKPGAVIVQGGAEFDLPETANITETFDRALFHKCLEVESAPNIQPPPLNESAFGQPIHESWRRRVHPLIHGLLLVEGFLTPHEEADLVVQIDAAEWREDLKRRVQHYGWRYDYKARQVNTEMRIGPLPKWAAQLAERLVREKLLPHLPDQVIVNEYKGKQGISKHVDCEPCFEDGIAMISLLESWEMIFSRVTDKKRESILLPHGSVAVIGGEARYQWTHEIPKRLTEPGGLHRKRRISITFRKVILNSVTGGSARGRRGRRHNNGESESN